ncbi:hypothetical protein Nepgr_001630 [Nepenthes gracilis]|uniref:Uncharacterized protein n=1 Tax=Nepenthes gracilis TaxID=150966 RepID=A0AAD3P595_NEPGR|nr:hypothetical protein Nepgr_001630 [Nepenthes gracilis]
MLAEDCQFSNSTSCLHLSSPSTDHVGLVEIALKQSIENSGDTLNYVRQLSSREQDPRLIYMYKMCIDAYDIALNQFSNAYVELVILLSFLKHRVSI